MPLKSLTNLEAELNLKPRLFNSWNLKDSKEEGQVAFIVSPASAVTVQHTDSGKITSLEDLVYSRKGDSINSTHHVKV